MLVTAAFTILPGLAEAVFLPPPTGKYFVGVSKHTIEHYNPHDLLAPNNVSTTHIGLLGYSLGGAAAIGSIYDDDRLMSSLNLDGSLLGSRPVFSDTRADAKKPVLLLGEELHTGEDAAHDITWGTFPLWQTAYFGKFLIDGTMHHDFCDDTFWKTIHPAYGSDHGSDRRESPGRNYELRTSRLLWISLCWARSRRFWTARRRSGPRLYFMRDSAYYGPHALLAAPVWWGSLPR